MRMKIKVERKEKRVAKNGEEKRERKCILLIKLVG